jgi:SAM-dependent methyltransferase
MSIVQRTVERLRGELFSPSLLGMLINPFYITRRALHENLRELAPGITGKVLDFGCGSKPYQALFQSASEYHGVDIQVSGHDHRQSKVDSFYDGKTLPFEDARFDSVVSFEALEHIFNPSQILGEINRVLIDGGRLLISVPFVWDEHEVPYDCVRYTSFGIRHVLGLAGFDVIELRKTTSYFLTVAQMFIAYLSQHVFPHRFFFRHLCQLLFVFPMTAAACLVDAVLPRRYDLYCDCVVMAQKSRRAAAVLL